MPTIDDVITAGALRYRDRLHALEIPHASMSFSAAKSALVESLEGALQKGNSLAPDDVTYNAGLYLPLLATGEWRYLDNQWGDGFGSQSPSVVALGTEEANDPFTDMPWKSGEVILTQGGGSWAVGAQLAKGLNDEPWHRFIEITADLPPLARRPDLFLQRMSKWRLAPRHTWSLVADAVGAGRGNLADLFASTYLVERSVHVSKRSSGGLPPSTERVVFMSGLVGGLARSARVLLIYGSTNTDAWEESPAYSGRWDWANREVTKSFLGVDHLDSPAVHDGESDGSPHHRIAVFDPGSHRVIWCRALSGPNVSDNYVARVRGLVTE